MSCLKGRRVSGHRSLEFRVWSLEFDVWSFFFFSPYLACIRHYKHRDTRSCLSSLCGMHVWKFVEIREWLMVGVYDVIVRALQVIYYCICYFNSFQGPPGKVSFEFMFFYTRLYVNTLLPITETFLLMVLLHSFLYHIYRYSYRCLFD